MRPVSTRIRVCVCVFGVCIRSVYTGCIYAQTCVRMCIWSVFRTWSLYLRKMRPTLTRPARTQYQQSLWVSSWAKRRSTSQIENGPWGRIVASFGGGPRLWVRTPPRRIRWRRWVCVCVFVCICMHIYAYTHNYTQSSQILSSHPSTSNL